MMQEAGVSFLTTWDNFYVIVGAAAATLTGLMFVVVTLMAGARIQGPTARAAVDAFSTPTIAHFGAALLVSAILSAPWPALWNAALLLGLSGLWGATYVVTALRRIRHMPGYHMTPLDWRWYMALPLIAYTALVVAALLLPGNPAPALFVIGAATILFLFIGIHNAWDIVTFLAIERSQPEDKSQDV